MREIKFRVWWKDHRAPTIYTEYDFFDDTWTSDEYIAIEQYTGLKDKNGKEIYEGDIVLVANYGRTPYIVIYREGDCCFVANNEFLKDYIHLFKGLNQCYEVIGNIHENPELIGARR